MPKWHCRCSIRLARDIADLSQLDRQQGVAAGLERRDIVELRGDVRRDGVIPVGAVGVDVLLHGGTVADSRRPITGWPKVQDARFPRLLSAKCYLL